MWLEDRVVMSTGAAQNQAVVTDVTSFYSNYVAAIPALASAVTGAADATTKTTAETALTTTAITTDALNNHSAMQLAEGPRRNPVAPMIRAPPITGELRRRDGREQHPRGWASAGSLLNRLLAVDSVEPGVRPGRHHGRGSTWPPPRLGDHRAARHRAKAVVTLTPKLRAALPRRTYFSDVAPEAAQLKTDQAAASTPPTTAQQATIDADVAAIDKTTVADVNTLATDLLTTMGTGSTTAIQQIITGIPTTSTGVTFTSSSGTASFGSLLATLQSIETDPTLLTDADTIAGIVSLFAFI